MSTIDTLINAVSAVAVNDVYRPYVRAGASDKHYLSVARLVSLGAAMLGLVLVPVFASFNSIYVAHGAFTASVTPAMVVAIVLAMYWRRFTSTAAFWTLLGGSILVALSILFPVLVTPFSHGVDPEGGFKYTRALYGLVGSGVIALVVTLLTKGRRLGELEGLVVGSLAVAKARYKGGQPNEAAGAKAACRLREDVSVEGVSVSSRIAESINATVGDIVYLSDARWWLGGLRSVHTRVTSIHADGDLDVLVAPSLLSEGRLAIERTHKIERII
jgi:SSS family solute:Na+ symporter